MSKGVKNVILSSKNIYIDRNIEENKTFPGLTIHLDTIDTILLLLNSKEEVVLINIMKHITEYIRKNDENILLLKEKNVLDLLLQKQFFRLHPNIIVKRFALSISATIIESMNCLVDMKTLKILEIVKVCLEYYKEDEDNFCLEYLSVIINKCLEDLQVLKVVLEDLIFVDKYFNIVSLTTNPDIIYHSFQLLEKMLLIQCSEDIHKFFALPLFPIKRILCELTNTFLDIRRVSLKVIRILILDTSENSPFSERSRVIHVLEQLTKMFCENLVPDETDIVVDVLAAAMRNEEMALVFFELNLFEMYLSQVNNEAREFESMCKALMVFAESAKYAKLLPRLVMAEITDKMLNCLLNKDSIPAPHILCGLNRMMKSFEASNRIIEFYNQGLLPKLLKLLHDTEINIKTREQAADLLNNLLTYAFHKTATELLELRLPLILAEIFGEEYEYQSIDLLLSLLSIIEILADNPEYREKIAENGLLIINLGMLLTKSFSTGILVNNIFRCLCTIVDEQSVRTGLLHTYICSSIKRALQSLSSLVKMSVTNFIMQTTRFPEFLTDYIDFGVLEVLIMNQKYAFCVPTWGPAIESILSKTPTMKFCIRNHLSFTDITAGQDFLVSKQKFDDFRIFQSILKDDVSPIQPVLVINYERSETPENLIVKVPLDCLTPEECKSSVSGKEWCYCRSPGDEFLPKYLQEVITLFEAENLTVNPFALKRCIDFDNITKRAKIIAQVVARVLGNDLKTLDLNTTEESFQNTIVKCHLKSIAMDLHCTFLPLGHVRSGCQFERAVLFKTLSDQVGLPCTLQRSVDGDILFNELPLPVELEHDIHCDKKTMEFLPWRMLRPTHIVDLMYNVGELYPIHSLQGLQYLRLF